MLGKFKDFEVYLIHVEEDRCEGCRECLGVCQRNVFDMSGKAYPAKPENCLGCKACVAVCKAHAIILTEI